MPKRRPFKRKGAKAVRKERKRKTRMKELLNRSPRSVRFEISLPIGDIQNDETSFSKD
jgi:hypothetical protein